MTSTLRQPVAQGRELGGIRLGYTPEYVGHLVDFLQRTNRHLCQQNASFTPAVPDRDPLKLALQVREMSQELICTVMDGRGTE